jgi:hypothetical protein
VSPSASRHIALDLTITVLQENATMLSDTEWVYCARFCFHKGKDSHQKHAIYETDAKSLDPAPVICEHSTTGRERGF